MHFTSTRKINSSCRATQGKPERPYNVLLPSECLLTAFKCQRTATLVTSRSPFPDSRNSFRPPRARSSSVDFFCPTSVSLNSLGRGLEFCKPLCYLRVVVCFLLKSNPPGFEVNDGNWRWSRCQYISFKSLPDFRSTNDVCRKFDDPSDFSIRCRALSARRKSKSDYDQFSKGAET